MRLNLKGKNNIIKKKAKKKDISYTGYKKRKRVVVVGVGNEFKADDGVGIRVAKSFEKNPPKGTESMAIATEIPENWIYKITRFCPDVMFIVDSADFGKRPGNFRILEEDELSGFVTSTHNIPLKIFLKEIRRSCNPRIHFIGIQPKNLEFGKGLSMEVKNSVGKVCMIIKELIEKNNK